MCRHCHVDFHLVYEIISTLIQATLSYSVSNCIQIVMESNEVLVDKATAVKIIETQVITETNMIFISFNSYSSLISFVRVCTTYQEIIADH